MQNLLISVLIYHPNDEGGLLWSDPDIGIDWPIPEGLTADDLVISEKDHNWNGIKAYMKERGL